jgi:hypothetical protein
MHAIKTNTHPEINEKSVIEYDSEYLRVAYWSALLNFSGSYPSEAWNKQKTIFLNNDQHKPYSLQGSTNVPISLQNNYNFPIFDLYIYSSNTEKIIFELPELPENKSINLEFTRDGVYELFYCSGGSSSISKTTFRISQTKNSCAKNFHWKPESLW